MTAQPTREEVRYQWSLLTAKRCSRSDVSGWAQNLLDQGLVGDEELVTQGLMFLQAADLAVGPGGHLQRGAGGMAEYVSSDDELAAALTRWNLELSDYDADPASWNRRYMRGQIRRFAELHGNERAREFGDKLVAADLLEPSDVLKALE